MRRLVTDDFEMFHDKGGRNITSGEQFATITKEKCQRQRDGIDFLSTRELVRDSVKVYPLNNYGAIETGTHRDPSIPCPRLQPGRGPVVLTKTYGRATDLETACSVFCRGGECRLGAAQAAHLLKLLVLGWASGVPECHG